ncbi:D-alanine--D-alanine ligase family protein [Luteibaculum oceani]|uniref:D-alanine--D-alanine ligase n=1 Tax=Luteibaculum oceani TaxID=1294296 RepID=A0A5C6VAW0_9FLAO|nr:D-alanine--D-alanine ligase family protein [Luteibaculum oceani]TXC81516.1 D-alanine--D-alanine ligase [Luteibaculum oceani]
MLNVFLFTGGYTGESVISYRTAETFKKHLDKGKYRVITIDIKRDGWNAFVAEKPAEFNHEICQVRSGDTTYTADVALIALHGPPGENGWLQGYLEMRSIPFTTGSTLCMSLSFNKKFSIDIASKNGIKTADSVLLTHPKKVDYTRLQSRFAYPLFVKPNDSGSSLGISKVKKPEDLQKAVELAFSEGKEVMVEELLTGTEVTCGVYRSLDKLIALPPTEIRSHNEFFDFNAKYNHASDEITPAEISDEATTNVQEAAKKIYNIFNCKGVIRVDFMVSEEGTPYLIELNTVPGMSGESIVPQQLNTAGIPFTEMLDDIIDEALAQ